MELKLHHIQLLRSWKASLHPEGISKKECLCTIISHRNFRANVNMAEKTVVNKE